MKTVVFIVRQHSQGRRHGFEHSSGMTQDSAMER